MGKTKQGNFDMTYLHIEAPTNSDKGYWDKTKKRRLIVPVSSGVALDEFRDPIFYELAFAPWQYKRKLDGANLRIMWDGEQALWNGKTNSFTCGADLTDYMNKTFLEEIFEEKFGREKKVYLFGEQMGKKVQNNELGLKGTEFILYDVNIGGFWLSPENIREIATYFNLKTCYDFMPQGEYVEDLVTLIQEVANGEFEDWEGIVATPLIECRNQKGNRVIVKIKNSDYPKLLEKK